MHVEIKVAQNFALNFLFNKLPRRRVNLFGEELESALSEKFADHWYPDKPFKGSAFRYVLSPFGLGVRLRARVAIALE